MIDVKDDSGMVANYRILHQDLAKAQLYATAEPSFAHVLENTTPPSRLPIYLAKKIAAYAPIDEPTMWSALNLVQVCRWYTKGAYSGSRNPILFLDRRSWFNAISRYASSCAIDVIAVLPGLKLRTTLRKRLPSRLVDVLRYLRYRSPRKALLDVFPSKRLRLSADAAIQRSRPHFGDSGPQGQDSTPQIAVEYIGHHNLDRPEAHSNLFFWQQSSLPATSLTVMYSVPGAPLDRQQFDALTDLGMQAVVLHPGASTIPSVPVLTPRLHSTNLRNEHLSAIDNGLDSRWLKQQTTEYHDLRSYWRDVFADRQVKVYVTYNSINAAHCAAADALQDLGGVTTVYRRSYEAEPSPVNTVGADIMFDFSHAGVNVQRRARSVIDYHVVTGYLGDHRFSLLRKRAGAVRSRLQQAGAKYILAFFDENSFDDPREGVDNQSVQENYHFLLERLNIDPSIGLVFKPKTPKSLRRRLGPVASLLDRSIETGRCYVYEETGAFQGSYPPAAGALEADITVGLLSGGTAAMEAALAEVPTLLLDREGCQTSPLYELGVGRVVFNDWETLWAACQQHWSTPGGMPLLGDWTPMLNELDPFRDGRAAERMGTYIHWLLEGFQAGFDREAIMADAAERYCSAWGDDKVTRLN